MKIYVGYIVTDYEHALYMGTDKTKIQKELDKLTHGETYIKKYSIKDGEAIELDCS